MDADPEVRVRFPSVVVKVVWLWGHNRVGGRAEWEAWRDERRPTSRQCGLVACPVSFVAAVVHPHNIGGALENLHHGLGRNYGKGLNFNSR